MTSVRSGVTIIYKCGTKFWTGGSVEGSVLLPFDGDTTTKADVQSASPRTCIGVDLGEPAYFTYMRQYSEQKAGNSNRVNGVVLSGSNLADWNVNGNFTNLTEPLQWRSASASWHERESLDSDNTYRYLFCHNPNLNGWNNNIWELQLYGWLESDLAGLAADVSDLAVSYGATPSATLTWTPVKYGTYTIERKTGDGEWTEVASGLSAATTTWTDTGVTAGTRYTYRVKTVNGANEAYSLGCEAIPYAAGNGVGLHGVWSRPYSTMDVGEAVVSVETNAVINFENATVGGETENFFVRWTGKLIVPFAGDYTFDAEADDTVALWIDGAPVLYRSVTEGAVTLTPASMTSWRRGSRAMAGTSAVSTGADPSRARSFLPPSSCPWCRRRCRRNGRARGRSATPPTSAIPAMCGSTPMARSIWPMAEPTSTSTRTGTSSCGGR